MLAARLAIPLFSSTPRRLAAVGISFQTRVLYHPSSFRPPFHVVSSPRRWAISIGVSRPVFSPPRLPWRVCTPPLPCFPVYQTANFSRLAKPSPRGWYAPAFVSAYLFGLRRSVYSTGRRDRRVRVRVAHPRKQNRLFGLSPPVEAPRQQGECRGCGTPLCCRPSACFNLTPLLPPLGVFQFDRKTRR